MVGYVYLLEEVPLALNEASKWTKIGYSQNKPEWRLDHNLKRGNPRDLQLPVVYEFETKQGAWEAEALVHQNFKNFLHQKEWFSLSWRDIAKWCDEQGWQRRQGINKDNPPP